jgi:hypothetical protein
MTTSDLKKPSFGCSILFGTPVYTSTIAFPLTKKLIRDTDKFIQKCKKENQSVIKERKQLLGITTDAGYGYRTSNLKHLKSFQKFGTFVSDLGRQFLSAQGYLLQNYHLKLKDLRAEEFSSSYGGHERKNIHNQGQMSGLLFLKCSNKTPTVIFEDPRPAKKHNPLPILTNPRESLAHNTYEMFPVPGAVLLFNSYLTYYFSPNLGLDNFRMITFDIEAYEK